MDHDLAGCRGLCQSRALDAKWRRLGAGADCNGRARLARLRTLKRGGLRELFVVDQASRLAGRVEIHDLAVGDPARPLSELTRPLLAAVQDPAIKEKLRAETERSIERGVFGSPFVFVDGEPFWGNDRLDQVEHWLATGGW